MKALLLVSLVIGVLAYLVYFLCRALMGLEVNCEQEEFERALGRASGGRISGGSSTDRCID